MTLLRTRFVPVAVDQHVHRRLAGAEGALFASILAQAGCGLNGYSQGFFAFTPGGRLLRFVSTRRPDVVRRLFAATLADFDPGAEPAHATELPSATEPSFAPPHGAAVLNVTAHAPTVPGCLGRDHMWLRGDETDALALGELPASVVRRVARFHLVDNTRGEPPMWREDEVRALRAKLVDGRVSGFVHLQTASGDRGYVARLFGVVQGEAGALTRFDMVTRGRFWGEGEYTAGAPPGRFPLVVAFTLVAAPRDADLVPPGCARRRLEEYLA